MRIIFVRHGKPDYDTDTLLEIGKRQAEAVAERLKDEGITEIYSSTHGRALETAAPTAKMLGLPINECDFIREINWGSSKGEELYLGGHPWNITSVMVAKGESISSFDWQDKGRFSGNDKLDNATRKVISGGDKWLESLGFLREGDYYRVIRDDTDKTVAMFSHGGASSTLMAHMLNIPTLVVYHSVKIYFTSVCILELNGAKGQLVAPKITLLSDARHVPKDEDSAEIKR